MRLYILLTLALIVVSPGVASATNCSTVVSCVLGENTSVAKSSDLGVEGISAHGYGVAGITSANPGSNINAPSSPVAGVFGKDQGPSNYNSGVLAVSLNGTGLFAIANKGDGVVGVTAFTSTTGTGTAGGIGVKGWDRENDPYGSGVLGLSTYGTGVTASSYSGPGFAASSTSGPGASVFSNFGDGIDVRGGSSQTGLSVMSGGQGAAVQLQVPDSSNLLEGFNGSQTLEFSFDSEGNETLTGHLTTSGGTVALTGRSGGAEVSAYGARTASPTLEDFGRGVLRAGAAYVSLDPTFASTIDPDSYLVFITPRGDSHGLYTTNVTARGFYVRENQSGRSSLTFDYRIVGRPMDMAGSGHLPSASTLADFSPTAKARAQFHKMVWPKAFAHRIGR